MLLSIDTIREHPLNARRIIASAEADTALMESIRTIGLLQPILVVPLLIDADEHAPAWELRAGTRRLRAAKALGWSEIPAVTLIPHVNGINGLAPETAISAAENMVRSAMHPVDQWRAISDLRTSSGYSLETASAALGVPMPLARRMEWLGAMAPELLDAIGTGDLPGAGFLRTIAMATHDMQRDALERGKGQTRSGDVIIDWRIVAENCTVRRLSRASAIFNPDLMAWDEDMFAEGDDEGRFTTSKVDEFLVHQREALQARVAKSKGRMQIYEQDPSSYRVTLPKGWSPNEYAAIPKRFAKDDARKVFVSLSQRVHDYGEVVTCLGIPAPARASAKDTSGQTTSPAARAPMTKKTMQQLARLKAEAVRSKLLEAQNQTPSTMLRAMLLMFTFNNVQAGGIAGSPRGTLAKLVTPEGTMRADVSDTDVCEAAAWLISTVITFDSPDEFRASGPGAEWLAVSIGAEMPRTDTVDILSGINGETLRDLAQAHGIPTAGTVAALRKRLAGALEDWRAVQFGAPGPQQPETDTGFSTNLLDSDDDLDRAVDADSDADGDGDLEEAAE